MNLSIRLAKKSEHPELLKILDEQVGSCAISRCIPLLQVIENDGNMVGILEWCSSPEHQPKRDEWIGWDQDQKTGRLGFVIMLRRFHITPNTYWIPNITGKCLTISTQSIVEQWEEQFSYPPLLAEAYCPIHPFYEGGYKQNNWIDLDISSDFNLPESAENKYRGPARLWIKTLNRNTKRILTSKDLPERYLIGAKPEFKKELALNYKQMLSLREFLAQHYNDPRSVNKSYPASSLFTVMVMAILAGRTNLKPIQKFGELLAHKHRVALDFPVDRKTDTRKAPSYSTLRNLLMQTDPYEFSEILSEWFRQNNEDLKLSPYWNKRLSCKKIILALSSHIHAKARLHAV